MKLYLLLGGNLGDKKTIFEAARSQLEKQLGEIMKQSAIYETEPWGFSSPDLFWNQALEISCSQSPEEVLSKIQLIEQAMGRIRKNSQYSSRSIDIDILFYEDQIIDLQNLVIPHPRLQERKFALLPMYELEPDFVHPVLRKSIEELLAECSDQLNVVKI